MENERRKTNYRLLAEFLILFAGLPLLFISNLLEMSMLSMLMIAAFFCFCVLLFDENFKKDDLWKWRVGKKELLRVVLMFLTAIPVFILFTYLFCPELLFAFVRNKPETWALVMVLYPLISVYPQELVYRVFFFNRYKKLFGDGFFMVFMSALMFGGMHIVFLNPVAVILSLIGGFIFSFSYRNTKSVLWVSVEHALYGMLIFTVGLGKYFYGGTILVGSLLEK